MLILYCERLYLHFSLDSNARFWFSTQPIPASESQLHWLLLCSFLLMGLAYASSPTLNTFALSDPPTLLTSISSLQYFLTLLKPEPYGFKTPPSLLLQSSPWRLQSSFSSLSWKQLKRRRSCWLDTAVPVPKQQVASIAVRSFGGYILWCQLDSSAWSERKTSSQLKRTWVRVYLESEPKIYGRKQIKLARMHYSGQTWTQLAVNSHSVYFLGSASLLFDTLNPSYSREHLTSSNRKMQTTLGGD